MVLWEILGDRREKVSMQQPLTLYTFRIIFTRGNDEVGLGRMRHSKRRNGENFKENKER
jgi:hypothetical protein